MYSKMINPKLTFYLLLTAIIYAYVTACELGLTFDSHAYIAAAKSFSAINEFNTTNGKPYKDWSPLYPFLLSFFTNDVNIFSIFFEGISLLIVITVIYYSTEKLIENSFLRIWVCLQAIFSPYLFLVSSFLWSEILFIAILWILLYVFFQRKHYLLCGSKPPNRFLLLIFFSNLLCLQRNTGIFIVLALGLCILLQKYSWQNLRWAVSYIVFSLLGFVIWHIRCEILTPAKVNLTENIFDFPINHVIYFSLHRLSTWFFPPQIPYFVRIMLLFLVIIYLIKEWIKIYKINNPKTALQLLPIIIGVYVVSFIILLRNFDADGDRYFAPIHAVFVLWLGILIDNKFKNNNFSLVKIIKISHSNIKNIILFFLLLWLCYPILRTLKNVEFWHQNNCLNSNQ